MQILSRTFLIVSTVCLSCNLCLASNKSANTKYMDSLVKNEEVLIDLIAGWLEAVVNIVDASREDLDQVGTTKNLSLGSGFLISPDGYIVTNNHVICDMNLDKLRILLFDGTEFVPKLVGRDPRSDIALLKIFPVTKLKYLKLGDSERIKVGMQVVAIGNPFGFGHTVTSGIISYKSRNLSSSLTKVGGGDLVNYLQTDAAINNGNSGGPLIALSTGNVIGMNASMFSNSDYNAGINFAIPANTIKSVIKQLKEFGKMKRAWLGIAFDEVPHDALKALKIADYNNAVAVTKIEANSPADIGGVKIGDIILEINGKKMSGDNKIIPTVSMLTNENKIKIKVKRGGVSACDNVENNKNCILELTLQVLYKVADEETSISDTVTAIGKRDGQYIDDLGVTVCELTSDLIKLLDIQCKKGIVITDISNATEKLDIQVGDVILTIEQENVASVNIGSINELKNCLSNIKKTLSKNEVSSIAMFIERNKNTYYKFLKFPAAFK